MAKLTNNLLFKDDLKSLNSSSNSSLTKKNKKPNLLFSDDLEQQSNPMQLELAKAQNQQQINPSTNGEQQGWPGVWEDVKGIAGQIPHALGQAALATPHAISQAVQQAVTLPYETGKFAYKTAKEGYKPENLPRATKNVYEGAFQGINTLPHLIEYLGKKGIIPKELASGGPIQFPSTGITEEEANPIIQAMPGFAGPAMKIGQKLSLPGLAKTFETTKSKERALKNALETIEETKKSHAEHLGHGEAHSYKASQEFLDSIEGKTNPETGKREGGLRHEVGSQYDKLAEDMAKEHINIQASPDMKAIQKSVGELGEGVTGEERENLIKILSAADSKKQISGADALLTYRELKHQAGKAYQEAYKKGASLSPEDRVKWIAKGDELTELQNKLKNQIESQLKEGKYLDRLKKIDTEYANKIAPLYKNRMYQEMLEHGQTSKNMMKYLYGSTKGNTVLNEIVGKNPELQRLIVGQEFAANPEKLALSNDYLTKFQKLNPKISRIINEQKAIQESEKVKIPEMQEAVAKAVKRKEARRNKFTGAALTAGGIGGAAAIEAALGRDWKKDIPLLLSLKALSKSSKK